MVRSVALSGTLIALLVPISLSFPSLLPKSAVSEFASSASIGGWPSASIRRSGRPRLVAAHSRAVVTRKTKTRRRLRASHDRTLGNLIPSSASPKNAPSQKTQKTTTTVATTVSTMASLPSISSSTTSLPTPSALTIPLYLKTLTVTSVLLSSLLLSTSGR